MSAPGRWRRVVWALVAALLVLSPGAEAQQAEPDPLSARTFRVRYRPLADAADVVSAVLSEQGSLTLRPRLGVLVVEDRVSVLDRVAALLESFDLPPRNVEVTLTLILGIDRRAEQGDGKRSTNAFAEELRGVLETLGDFIKWQSFEPLGSRSVTGVEGREVRADLTPDYRVVFTVDSVHAGRRLVDFERVELLRLRRDQSGRESTENLYAAAMVVKMDGLQLVGAASGPESKRALFLAVQVRER